MKTKTYNQPQEAYDLMNQWTQIKSSYETQFQKKNVTKVDIMFDGKQPRFASVHYQTDSHIGVSSIDLSQKILLDKPEKQSINHKLLLRS